VRGGRGPETTLTVERAVFAMFVASGFCGLVYQIIW